MQKTGFFIEFFSLKLVEANYKAYKQLKANRDMLVQKDPDFGAPGAPGDPPGAPGDPPGAVR